MVVLMPRTSYSSSARAMRAIASVATSAQATSLAIIES